MTITEVIAELSKYDGTLNLHSINVPHVSTFERHSQGRHLGLNGKEWFRTTDEDNSQGKFSIFITKSAQSPNADSHLPPLLAGETTLPKYHLKETK